MTLSSRFTRGDIGIDSIYIYSPWWCQKHSLNMIKKLYLLIAIYTLNVGLFYLLK